MNVLIKDMEMPKNCGECQFCHTENFKIYCCPTDREDIFYDAIPEWCPLEEPKTGEWIKFTLEGGFLSSHKCSNCGFNGNQLWHFCPNCGALMRKEGE